MSTAIGQPLNRVDGFLKTTGTAHYAADYPEKDVTYGIPILSTIANGKVKSIDTSAAEKAPGVLTIITRENLPKLKKPKNDFGSSTKLGEERPIFDDNTIYYAGQYLGLLVADSLERAITAARLVKVEEVSEPPVIDVEKGKQFEPADDFARTKYSRGDAAGALKAAPHQVRETYRTPVEHHNPMEPSASLAVWEGDKLTLFESTQWIVGARNVVADTLGIPRDNVHVISNYVGGGFGCKGFVWPHSILAAIAAQKVQRPVKVVLPRQNMFTGVGHRGETMQVLALGADEAGKLLAIEHDNLTQASLVDDFIERSGVITSFLYECPNVRVKNTGSRVHIATPTPMRAPGESPGLFALESALDELAWQLKMDPIELRLRNYAETDPEKKLPYSTKRLRDCYEKGKEAFGWRPQEAPASHREGRYLTGWGMATATYPGYRNVGSARVRIMADGMVIVASATQDIGTGTYTTMTQVAADTLGVSTTQIRAELGDSLLPPGPVSGGSMTTASITPAVLAASLEALAKLKQCAIEDEKSALYKLKVDDLDARDGHLFARSDPGRRVSFGNVLRSRKVAMIEAESTASPGLELKKYAFHSFGAQFSEVRVDGDTGEIRVMKHLAVFDIGRVINPKTARSQALGGVIMGIGMALMEHTVYDRDNGRVINSNLADYAMPVNADIRNVEAVFVEEPDYVMTPVGARGVGEIGITGVAASIANAVYHATGIRVRDLPITPEKMFGVRL